MRKICTQVFQLSELSKAAQESARGWFRQNAMDYEWFESTYEDAASIADILGIDLRTRKVQFRGTTKYDGISIGFSGFSSQGDGAHFEGRYSYAKGAAKAIREYAPQDTVLHGIADALQALQRKHFYGVKATVKHRGHYQHENCTDIDVEITDYRYEACRYPSPEVQKEVEVILRKFMSWIYRSLEKEYDFQNSDEQVDMLLDSNGYEFTEDGSRSISIH